MKICSIASGSSGNCTYIEDGTKHILVDAGVSRKRIVDGMKQIGADPAELDAIFVTHEHIDHIQGIPVLANQFDLPIYATAGTLDGIRAKDTRGVIRMEQLFQIYPDQTVDLGSIHITPYHISHDAADPVGYRIESGGCKAGIATDLGYYDDYIVNYLEGCDVLLLEANHDISMLEAGPYPYRLKCRILGERGHLSNEDSGRLLCRLMEKGLRHVFLAHLSKENNYPELAYQAVKCQIWEELGKEILPFEMEVADRDQPSRLVTV